MEPTPSNAPRATRKNTAEKASDNIRLEPVANRQLTAQAKKLQMSKTKYASAAIAYFAETGLNPTQERPHGLANVSSKVSQEARAVKELNVAIGNRLIAIIRQWEKNQYAFLQQQQLSLHTYLELIESNLLQHLVAVESNLFDAMIEKLLKLEVEMSTTRGLASLLFLKAFGKPESEFPAHKATLDRENEQELITAIQNFLKTNAVPKPQATAKRAVTPAPQKPVAPVTAAPPVPTPVPKG
jgi:hypothetical protein